MIETYIQDRVEPQIDWYDKKSISYKKNHLTLKISAIICSISIPFIAGLNIKDVDCHVLQLIVGLLGLIIAFSEGISSLFKYHDKWQEYRTTCETLKHHKYLYETKSGIYIESEGRDSFFVQNIEHLISQENSKWIKITNKKNE